MYGVFIVNEYITQDSKDTREVLLDCEEIKRVIENNNDRYSGKSRIAETGGNILR